MPWSLHFVADAPKYGAAEKIGHSGPFGFAQGRRDDKLRNPLHDFGAGIGGGVAGVAGGIPGGVVGGFGRRSGLGIGGVLGFGEVVDEGFLDDFVPGSFEGVPEFLLGVLLGAEEELAEMGEGDGGFGLDVAHGGGAEEGGEAGGEIGSGESVVVEMFRDEGAELFGVDEVAMFMGMVVTEAHVSGKARHRATTAIGKMEDTTIGFILGDGHRNLLKIEIWM